MHPMHRTTVPRMNIAAEPAATASGRSAAVACWVLINDRMMGLELLYDEYRIVGPGYRQ